MKTSIRARLGITGLAIAASTSACGVNPGALAERAQDAALGDSVTTSTTPTSWHRPQAPAVGTDAVASCEDWSGSVRSATRQAGSRGLATAIRGRLGALPTDPNGQTPGAAALRVLVRAIGSDSYATSGSLVLVDRTVPAVTPIATSRPDFTAEAVDAQVTAEQASAWNQDARQYKAQHQAAVEASEQVASAVEQATHSITGNTDISGCISAVGEWAAVHRFGTKWLVIVSDLDANGVQNRAGRLDGFKVLLVLQCDDATSCQARQNAWTQQLKGLGATDVTPARADDPDAIPGVLNLGVAS
jgi:hypothetical protein